MRKFISPSIMSISLPVILLILITVSSLASEKYELVTEWGSSVLKMGSFMKLWGWLLTVRIICILQIHT